MRKTMTLRELVPWTRYNEWEGEVTGEIDGRLLSCHVLMANPAGWRSHRSGEVLDIELRLERSGSWSRLPAGAAPSLRQVAGVEYELSGTVLEAEGERLVVDAGLVLEVDLDLPAGQPTPDFARGDGIRVQGQLQADLDPDA
jgi:hypothetical protein